MTERIRAATSDDADDIARVHVQAWRETYRGLVADAMLARLSVVQRADMWRSVFTDATKAPVLRVIDDGNGAIVGFGSAGPARGESLQTEGEIMAIYLLDSVKRRGLGRALFTQLLAALAEKGLASAGLWVLASNAPACRFYETMGGRKGATRTEERDGVVLTEVAYLWDLKSSDCIRPLPGACAARHRPP